MVAVHATLSLDRAKDTHGVLYLVYEDSTRLTVSKGLVGGMIVGSRYVSVYVCSGIGPAGAYSLGVRTGPSVYPGQAVLHPTQYDGVPWCIH